MEVNSVVEMFHLTFLEQLSLKIDKRLYALKGGCNLRFFFKSIRYSEDIDFDVHTIAVATLEKNISNILQGSALKQTLLAKSISIVDFSTPKQTTTTQRWKIKIKHVSSHALNTKIEFSRRENFTTAVLEPINRNICLQYNLRSLLISHYPANTALKQKIIALALRTETQARDVFDTALLLQQGATVNNTEFSQEDLHSALNNASVVTFSAFKSQVVSFLENEYLEQYSDPNIWENILLTVVEYIGGLYEAHTRIQHN